MDGIELFLWKVLQVSTLGGALALICWSQSGLRLVSRWQVVEPKYGSSMEVLAGRSVSVNVPGQSSAAVISNDGRGGLKLSRPGSATLVVRDSRPVEESQHSLRLIRADSVFDVARGRFLSPVALSAFSIVWSHSLLLGNRSTVGSVLFVLGAFGVNELLQRRLHRSLPLGVLTAAVFLTVVGLLVQGRIDQTGGERQLAFSLGALLTFAAVSVLAAPLLAELRPAGWLALGIGSQLLLLVPPFRSGAPGSSITATILGLDFQPSEFARLGILGFLGGYLAMRRGDIRASAAGRIAPQFMPRFSTLLPLLLAGAIFLVLQALHDDHGPGLIVYVSAVIGAWLVVGLRRYLMVGSVLLPVLSLAAAVLSPRSLSRLGEWSGGAFDPSSQQGLGLAASQRGGFFGVGAADLATALDTPVVESDLVIAMVLEQGGWLLFAGVVLSYAVMVSTALTVWRSSRDEAIGAICLVLSMSVAVGAAVNVLGALGVIPFTGVPLPLVSAGGTSILCTWLILAVVLLARSSSRSDQGGVIQ